MHVAHLILAEEMRERFGLDRILFVPSGEPPHKRGNFPSGSQRLEMVRRAVAGNTFFSAVDIEVRRPGFSYTIETLRELRRRFPDGREFFFLIGMDAFMEITTWYRAEELLDWAHFVIFPRPGFPLEDPGLYTPRAWRSAPPRPAPQGGATLSREGKEEPVPGGSSLAARFRLGHPAPRPGGKIRNLSHACGGRSLYSPQQPLHNKEQGRINGNTSQRTSPRSELPRRPTGGLPTSQLSTCGRYPR